MRRVFDWVMVAALPAAAAFSQSAQPSFDLASVKVSPRATWVKNGVNAMRGGFLLGDRYEIHRATMLDLIRLAYNVDADKIYGGPSWLDYDKLDIAAKTKPGTGQEALRLMLQALLADRFGLSVKPDTQPLPAYVLSAGKDQTKLKPAESGSNGGCQTVPGARSFPAAGPPLAEIRCQNVTMDEFISGLRRLAVPFFQGVPAINSSGIEGAWDIDIKYPQIATRITAAGTETLNANSLFEAIDKQLGLKLELGKAPQPVLSVTSVREQPTPDAAGVEAALPPAPPPHFDVAAVRACDTPNPANGPQRPGEPRIEPGGRVTATCFPLLLMLRRAFDITAGEQIAGLPKSLQGDTLNNYVSIDARAPAGSVPNNADAAQTRDVLNALLRGLLVDRFKLAYHYEDRPVDALTLVATKPKLTKADPSGRTGCTEVNKAGVKLVCTNITMAQFAEQIPAHYVLARYPVLDGTHLDGAWDFTIEYNPTAGLLQQLVARTAAAAAAAGRDIPANAEAPEPSGPVNLAEALEKQIGLKLESHKRPEPVLVIDHMEEKPTDN